MVWKGGVNHLNGQGETYSALVQLAVHLATDMVDVVVDHGQGDTDREDGYGREADGRVADEAVRLDFRVDVHRG